MHFSPQRYRVEALEIRTLLAVFNGTNGADDIRIFCPPEGLAVQVDVNGQENITTDQTITINALGGDDHVYLLQLSQGIEENRALTIDLGDGDDTFTNVEPDTGKGSFNQYVSGTATILGGAGNDTLDLDDSAGTSGDTFCHFDSAGGSEYSFTVHSLDSEPGTVSTLDYDSSIESVNFTESLDNAVGVDVNAKPATTSFAVQGFGISIGGGDIDGNGFSQNNTTLTGNGTNNVVTFDDHLDANPLSYVINGDTFGLGAPSITFDNFNSSFVELSNTVGASQTATPNVVDVESTHCELEIDGSNLRPSNLFVGAGNLSSIHGGVSLKLGRNTQDSLTIDDQFSTADTDYQIAPSGFGFVPMGFTTSLGVPIDMDQVDQLNLNAGKGDNTVTLGSGNLNSDIPFPVSLTGGSGSDTLVFDDSDDMTNTTQTLNAAAFTLAGTSYSVTGFEGVRIDEGPGGEDFTGNPVPIPTSILGNTGPDDVTLGGGNLDARLLGGFTFSAGGGTDSLLLDDHTDTGDDSYFFPTSTTFHKTHPGPFGTTITGPTVSFTNVESETLSCNVGNNTISVTGALPGLTILGNAGNDTVEAASASTFTLDTGSEVVSGQAFGDEVDVAGSTGGAIVGGLVRLNTSDHIGTLITNAAGNSAANGAGKFQLSGSSAVLDVTHLLTLDGVIDISGGSMIARAGVVLPGNQTSFFSSVIKAGYNGGLWNGTTSTIGTSTLGAINSSAARVQSSNLGIGFGLASQIFSALPGTFAGQSVNANDILLKLTTLGDANLDGNVNALDFNAVASNFGGSSKNWDQGDFNYDGQVTTSDFTMLANHFNQTLATPPADVPPAAPGMTATSGLFSSSTIAGDEIAKDTLLDSW